MTETTRVASSASGKGASKKAALKQLPAPNLAQSSNARKRWSGVPAAERSANARAMAKTRWQHDATSDADIRHYFETADLDEAMEQYQGMRKTYEAVGKLLDTRFQNERQQEECCSNPACKNGSGGVPKKFDRNNGWFYRDTRRDPGTNRMYNTFACCAACMVLVGGPQPQKRA